MIVIRHRSHRFIDRRFSVSLPVRLFEPRSFLGRLSDTWSCAPDLFSKASKQLDPVERFKYVIAFAIAGLHVNIGQWKPFNPIRMSRLLLIELFSKLHQLAKLSKPNFQMALWCI